MSTYLKQQTYKKAENVQKETGRVLNRSLKECFIPDERFVIFLPSRLRPDVFSSCCSLDCFLTSPTLAHVLCPFFALPADHCPCHPTLCLAYTTIHITVVCQAATSNSDWQHDFCTNDFMVQLYFSSGLFLNYFSKLLRYGKPNTTVEEAAMKFQITL